MFYTSICEGCESKKCKIVVCTRARERVRDSIRMPSKKEECPLSPRSLAVLLEKQNVVLPFQFCNLEKGTIVTSRQVVHSRVTYAYFFWCYICIKITVQVLL